MGRHEMNYSENDNELDNHDRREPQRDRMRIAENYAQIATNYPSEIENMHN